MIKNQVSRVLLATVLIVLSNCTQFNKTFNASEVSSCKSKCTTFSALLYVSIYTSGEAICNAQSSSYQANAVATCFSTLRNTTSQFVSAYRTDCNKKCEQ